MQKVLIVGSDWPASLEASYASAFNHLGWQVERWNPANALRAACRGGRVGHVISGFVHVERWVRQANMSFLQFAQNANPSLVLIIATSGVRAGTLTQLQVLLPRAAMYCIYPDSPHNLDAERICCLPVFRRVAVSSPAWVASFRALGAQCVEYLPFAADTFLHQPAASRDPAFAVPHELGFIGNWRPEREELLEKLVDFDLNIWGAEYWKQRVRKNSPLRKKWGGRVLIGSEFAQACSQNAIMLNIMDPVTWPGPNMRMFEQPACRAFSLVSRSPAVLELFTEGSDIECFDSAEEAREKAKFYLANPARREQVANRAYELVVQGGHTYIARAKTIMGWFEEDALHP
jgi:hypothetical protein